MISGFAVLNLGLRVSNPSPKPSTTASDPSDCCTFRAGTQKVSEGTAMGPGFLHTHYFPHFVDCYQALWFLHT